MTKQIRFFAIIFALISFSALGQNTYQDYNFVSIKEGIPKVGVTEILQDHKGFIWIATNSTGIYKFDGINYTSYKHIFNDSTSLSSSRIECAYLDSKNKLWVGTENGLNIYVNELDQFNRIVLDVNNPNNDNVTAITEDASNNLFIGTYDAGVYKLNTNTLQIQKVLNSTFEKNSQRIDVNDIIHTGGDKIYVATNFGLKEIEITSNKLIHAQFYTKDKTSFDNGISTLFFDNNNNLWIGPQANEGVYKCSLNKNQNNSITHVKQIKLTSKKILSFIQLPDNSMMIGTENDGLFHIDVNDNIIKHRIYNKIEENSILHNSIWELFVDKDDRIWLGYFNSGIAVSDQLYDKFRNIRSLPNKENSLKIASVKAVIKDGANLLWMATDGGGIDVFNPKNQKITHINKDDVSGYSGLTSNYMMSLFKDSNENIWAGSWDGGLFFLKKGSKKFINYNTNNTEGLKSNTIMSLTEDANGIIWIGSFYSGLHAFNPKTKKFTFYNSEDFVKNRITTTDILKVLIDSDDNLWLATVNGAFKIEKEGEQIKKIYPLSNKISEEFNKSFNAKYVLNIYEDSKKNIWIGTRGVGLCKYDKVKNEYKWYNRSNGLLEENVAAIIEDNQNNIWVSGNSGLTKIDLELNEFTNYTFNDGLLSNDFNYGSVFKDSEGMLYFGNFKGLDYFNPSDLKTNLKVPKLHLTDFKLFNEKVIPNKINAPLTKVIAETDSLTLTSKQSVFTIEYGGLNFTRPEKNNYAYYLEGYEDSWNYVGQKRSATYTNLDHGDYIFKLKASNNDGMWNEKPLELKIKILPPWWKTNWAVAIYITLFFLSIYLLNYFTQRRIKEKELIRNERLQRQQTDELNKKKIQFFTNISHEFRTPLTLIINPLKDIINNAQLNLPQQIKNKHAIIYKNTDRLYRLINELMDFRKLELSNINVRAKKTNLINFTKNIVSYFEEEANNKNIFLSLDADVPDLTVWADNKMLEKIIFNLLSNAIKITPEGGAINIDLLSTDKLYNLPLVNKIKPVKAIEIIISDTGPGLEKHQIDKIFERFYQVERQSKSYFGGTGIGLEVVQSFVKLHKGKIKVNSKVGKGTTFKILLPEGNNHFSTDQIILNEKAEYTKKEDFLSVPIIDISDQQPDDDIKVQKQHTILVVEDNVELRDYLKTELQNHYKILLAGNGNEGIKIAKDTFPDLIITDVIMPEMGGFDFCKAIKTDTSTSHIPLLMLTAKASIENRIEGIETGADAYMVKPFDLKLLKLRISQLITSRQLIFDKYFGAISGSEEHKNATSIDKDFIQKLLDYINDNISDSNLSVEELASQLNLSRSQLYRKIKAITGQTVNEFIRKIRLERAKQILEKGSSNISETCYNVGFASPSYFSKCFKAHFGILPTEVEVKNNL